MSNNGWTVRFNELADPTECMLIDPSGSISGVFVGTAGQDIAEHEAACENNGGKVCGVRDCPACCVAK